MFPLTFSVTCQCHQNTNTVLVTPRDILVTPSLDYVPVSSLLPSSPRLTAHHRGQTQFPSHSFLSKTIYLFHDVCTRDEKAACQPHGRDKPTPSPVHSPNSPSGSGSISVQIPVLGEVRCTPALRPAVTLGLAP